MARIVREDDVDVGVIHAVMSESALNAARGEARSLINRLRPLVDAEEEAGNPFPAIVKALHLVSEALEDAADLYN